MLLIKVVYMLFFTTCVSCTIAGLSYMDQLELKPSKPAGNDECNPLYWYPRSIPEYCYYKTNPKPGQKPMPVPLPIAIPVPPQPIPVPVPLAPMPPVYTAPFPISPGYPIPPAPIIPMPIYQPPIPLPYGIPIAPTNPMLPMAGLPLSYPSPFPVYRPRYQAGMVPGLPGLVTQDGGINVLPFSDAYADLLEKHKQKMIRKRVQRVYDDYDDYPNRKDKRRKRKRH